MENDALVSRSERVGKCTAGNNDLRRFCIWVHKWHNAASVKIGAFRKRIRYITFKIFRKNHPLRWTWKFRERQITSNDALQSSNRTHMLLKSSHGTSSIRTFTWQSSKLENANGTDGHPAAGSAICPSVDHANLRRRIERSTNHKRKRWPVRTRPVRECHSTDQIIDVKRFVSQSAWDRKALAIPNTLNPAVGPVARHGTNCDPSFSMKFPSICKVYVSLGRIVYLT